MKEKVLFQYLEFVKSHGSVFGPDWVGHTLNELSIPWKLDLLVTAALSEGHFEISVFSSGGSNGSYSTTFSGESH